MIAAFAGHCAPAELAAIGVMRPRARCSAPWVASRLLEFGEVPEAGAEAVTGRSDAQDGSPAGVALGYRQLLRAPTVHTKVSA